MNRQSIHQEIEVLLNTLREQHEQFRGARYSIPQQELDLLLQNSRQLYEAMLLLNHTNALSSLDEVKAAVTQRLLAEKRAIEKKTAEKTPVENPKPAETPVAEPKPREAGVHPMAEVIAKAAEEKPVEEKKDKVARPKKLSGGVNATLFEDTHTHADNFEDEMSLHEHIAAKGSGQTVSDLLHRKPVHDLKAAIGINEKFLFINQLFDGNLHDYSEAIEKLNAMHDLASAKQFVSAELATRFNWNDNNDHVRNFMELVERRFIAA
jgi:hypothetical protein